VRVCCKVFLCEMALFTEIARSLAASPPYQLGLPRLKQSYREQPSTQGMSCAERNRHSNQRREVGGNWYR
jgi:hypothetical protein